MNIDKVVVDFKSGMTTEEKMLIMLKRFEEQFNTGPIIGEAREVVLHLLHNLYTRDLYIDAMGVDVEKREKIFKMISEMEEEHDEKVLASRGESNENNSN